MAGLPDSNWRTTVHRYRTGSSALQSHLRTGGYLPCRAFQRRSGHCPAEIRAQIVSLCDSTVQDQVPLLGKWHQFVERRYTRANADRGYLLQGSSNHYYHAAKPGRLLQVRLELGHLVIHRCSTIRNGDGGRFQEDLPESHSSSGLR